MMEDLMNIFLIPKYSCYNIHITKLFIRASLEQVVTSEIVIKVG